MEKQIIIAGQDAINRKIFIFFVTNSKEYSYIRIEGFIDDSFKVTKH